MSDNSSYSGTITHLLNQLPNKDEQVVQDVFNFYFQGLARRARKVLHDRGGVTIADGEDLAMLVITAFLKDATEGEFGALRSRHDVWRMLAKRVRLRAINMVRDEKRQKKDEVGESVFRDAQGEMNPMGIQEQPAREVDAVEELHLELLTLLSNSLERQVATLLLDGNDIQQISQQIGKSPATIYRKIARIKERWLVLKKFE